jgi:hypothetical protein
MPLIFTEIDWFFEFQHHFHLMPIFLLLQFQQQQKTLIKNEQKSIKILKKKN